MGNIDRVRMRACGHYAQQMSRTCHRGFMFSSRLRTTFLAMRLRERRPLPKCGSCLQASFHFLVVGRDVAALASVGGRTTDFRADAGRRKPRKPRVSPGSPGSGLAITHLLDIVCAMARPLRLELSGGIYHVTSRGDGREDIYLSDADRVAWLEVFCEVCERLGLPCLVPSRPNGCRQTGYWPSLVSGVATPLSNTSVLSMKANVYPVCGRNCGDRFISARAASSKDAGADREET